MKNIQITAQEAELLREAGIEVVTGAEAEKALFEVDTPPKVDDRTAKRHADIIKRREILEWNQRVENEKLAKKRAKGKV